MPYRSVPVTARNDPRLYEALALVDAIRGGRSREELLSNLVYRFSGSALLWLIINLLSITELDVVDDQLQ